jgi:Family of unknown function (DUF6879)
VALLTLPELNELYDSFEHSVFKLEVRDRYNLAAEQESLRRFLAGQPDPERATRPWLAKMQAATGQGKRVERVRVVSEPHSDYIRWELAGTPYNLAAGEDIRYLPRDCAEQVGLPDHDFALFDSTRLVLLHFDADDQPLPHELTTDPAVVVRHCYWRDLAWHYAIPYSQYSAR